MKHRRSADPPPPSWAAVSPPFPRAAALPAAMRAWRSRLRPSRVRHRHCMAERHIVKGRETRTRGTGRPDAPSRTLNAVTVRQGWCCRARPPEPSAASRSGDLGITSKERVKVARVSATAPTRTGCTVISPGAMVTGGSKSAFRFTDRQFGAGLKSQEDRSDRTAQTISGKIRVSICRGTTIPTGGLIWQRHAAGGPRALCLVPQRRILGRAPAYRIRLAPRRLPAPRRSSRRCAPNRRRWRTQW